jgi:hypothetical protein
MRFTISESIKIRIKAMMRNTSKKRFLRYVSTYLPNIKNCKEKTYFSFEIFDIDII